MSCFRTILLSITVDYYNVDHNEAAYELNKHRLDLDGATLDFHWIYYFCEYSFDYRKQHVAVSVIAIEL